MKEIYCLPLTAATNKLHIGNLYSWVLADSYKKALDLLDKDVEIRESWNCFSKRLEDEVSSKFFLSEEGLVRKCNEIIEDNITLAQDIFSKYDISFSHPIIRDDSLEYQDVVIRDYNERNEDGRIKDFFLRIPDSNEILKKASNVSFHHKNSLNSLKGISSLEGVSSISILRKGDYGIKIDGAKNMVLGQRYVQSLLPKFYLQSIGIPDMAIFGKDVLAKWVYFMIANSYSMPFRNLGLHGLILKKEGGKISKYDSRIPLLKEINSSPDNVRLSLIKQTFGLDFKFPNFDDEEKFRRKIENCLNFFITYQPITKGCERSEIGIDLEEIGVNLSNKIRILNFSGAYQDFKSFTYNKISSLIIPLIRNEGISQVSMEKVISEFSKISRIFAPITVKNKLLQNSNYSIFR